MRLNTCQGSQVIRKMALNSAETKEGTEDNVQKCELAGRLVTVLTQNSYGHSAKIISSYMS